MILTVLLAGVVSGWLLAWGNTGTSGTGPSREPGGQNDREDRTPPAGRINPPLKPRPQHRRRQRGNASRNRRPPRGAKRQLHPGRRFSTQIHTWRIAWLAISSETKMRASPSTRCERNPSYQPYRRSCGTARARDHPFRHLDRICDHATADHGRDGSTRAASFHRPNLASRRVRSNLVVCYRYASLPFPRNC